MYPAQLIWHRFFLNLWSSAGDLTSYLFSTMCSKCLARTYPLINIPEIFKKATKKLRNRKVAYIFATD